MRVPFVGSTRSGNVKGVFLRVPREFHRVPQG